MALLKNTSPRRREVRRHLPREAPRWQQWWGRKEVWWAAGFTAVLVLVGILLAALGQDHPRYALGRIITEPVVPRVRFQAVDEQVTRENRRDAFNREPARYQVRHQYIEQIRERIEGLTTLADRRIERIDQLPAQTRQELGVTSQTLEQLRRIQADPQARAQWEEAVHGFISDLQTIALLSPERAQAEKDPRERAPGIVIIHPDMGAWERKDFVVYSPEDDQEAVQGIVEKFARARFPEPLVQPTVRLVMQGLQAFYALDSDLTGTYRAQAAQKEPEIMLTYTPTNDVLVPAWSTLNQDDLNLIAAEQAHYQVSLTPLERTLRWLGRAGLVALIGAALWLYVLSYNERIARNPMRGLAITALLLGCQALAVAGTLYLPWALYATATLPTLLVAMVMVIVYDRRLALAMGVLHALLVMVTLSLPVTFILVTLAGVAAIVAQLEDVRTRSKLVITGFWAGAAMFLATLAVELAVHSVKIPDPVFMDFLKQLTQDAGFTFVAGVLAGLAVQGLLPGIERLFKVTTAMTLKELNEASHPLLQRLRNDAPGTYQHSLRIADMAEAAADSIGGNGLACRVGAMFHDIGKVNKPGYFVENQGGGPNRHAKLSPAMSLLIIVGHVKDGIELAREYSLPPVIRGFIETHHGTTLVEYFYHAAKQQSEAESEPAPKDFEFRYPGPKPRAKEEAILMICDGVEGAARTLPEPTPVRLEQLVHMMAQKRLMDGQFDECNLTLKELHRIEQAITKTLCAIYHTRIKYPSDAEQPPYRQERAERPAAPAAAAS